MAPDYLFKWCFAVVFSLLVLTRLFFRIRYDPGTKMTERRHEGIIFLCMRGVLSIPLIFSFYAYVFRMRDFQFLYLEIPYGLRVVGVVLGFSAVVMLGVVHYFLGENFSISARLKSNHRLITRGPYRYVRHPMYLTFMVLFLAAFLMTRNWMMGVSGILILLSLMTIRLKREEAFLIDYFGEDYKKYMERTGKFFPRVFPSRN